MPGYFPGMNGSRENHAPEGDDALVEALVSGQDSSFVDALFALAQASGQDNGAPADAAIGGGFEAALARRMRIVIERRTERRDAA